MNRPETYFVHMRDGAYEFVATVDGASVDLHSATYKAFFSEDFSVPLHILAPDREEIDRHILAQHERRLRDRDPHETLGIGV